MSVHVQAMQTFLDTQTREVSLSWISNRALYDAFLRWAPWNVQLARKLVPYQSFARFLGHNLCLANVRRWVQGKQVYGRRLWPLQEIREKIEFGVDYF